ncbi:MAG TPA: hypothetical protein VHZ24_04025 [Pirellulales bacterium]|nr:hypothetical protein [Pirellulales bacterium]
MIQSVPGAGDILGDPQAAASKEQPSRESRPNKSSKISRDAFDPPADSGIGPNPNHPLEDGVGDELKRDQPTNLEHEARQFADHAGGVEQAIELLRSLHDTRK